MSHALSKQVLVYKLAQKQVQHMLMQSKVQLDETGGFTDSLIHEIRVCAKKLRALLQLYRPFYRPKKIKNLDKAIKLIACAYSGQRDAAVQYTLLCRAIDAIGTQSKFDFAPLKAIFAQKLTSMHSHSPDLAVDIKFQATMALWHKTLNIGKSKHLKSGIKHTYRKCRRISNKAIASDGDALFHQSRKWIKYYFYQLKILNSQQKITNRKYLKKLEEIGELLGEFHDDCMLEESLNQLLNAIQQQEAETLNISITTLLNWLAEQKERHKQLICKRYTKIF